MTTEIIKMIVLLSIVLFFVNTPPANASSGVAINEIAWAGTTEGWRYEWVELFNDSGGVIDITGWQIDNGASSNKSLVLSAGTISSGGYFLVCRKEMAGCDLVETKLSLHNEYDKNGKLTLKNNSGSVIDSTPAPNGKTWPVGDNGTKQTMERIKNTWQTSQEPNGTPKSANSIIVGPSPPPEPTPLPEPVSPESDPDRLPEPDVPAKAALDVEKEGPEPSHPGEPSEVSPEQNEGPLGEGTQDPSDLPQDDTVPEPQPIEYPVNIFINEILPSPEGADAEHEWIELYNGNNLEVDLSNWQIRDKIGAVKTYTYPINTKIAPYGFFLLPRTQSNITLQNSGDGLELLNPNQEIIYSVDYPKAPQGQSYNRIDETWSWSTTLTPEKQNIITQPKKLSESRTLAVKKNTPPEDTDIISQTADTLANIEKTVTNTSSKTSSRIITFIFAVIIAVGSGVVVLLLKKNADNKNP